MPYKPLAVLFLATSLLGGCAEIEFGSHLYKSATYHEPAGSRPVQQGNFKVGNPYTINGTVYRPRETYEYVESGISSWYGPGFHGKKTASGETYDKRELTAAHRTLQMPSLVRVTNLGNGKSVVVRINDRGPFAKGRIIDVSERAAQLLDMVGPGTAKVKVELLANESRMIAEAARRGENIRGSEIAMNTKGTAHMSDALPPETVLAQTASADQIPGHYTNGRFYPDQVVTQLPVKPTGIYVQAGAFGVHENAERLSQKLGAYAPARVEPIPYNGRTLYKVKLGPLQNVSEADKVLSRVLAGGHSDAIIVVQ